ncbi:hypothetical protein [Azospirillum thermophilum]|uniref:hypothetical protein n=1 Tax=Azospirillum thermophilum TaxID=2202148 RepID=UPI00143CE067|nr:hypothetical protein [Azospirillum thermophilum]
MTQDATVRKALLIPAELAQRVDDYRFEKRFRTDAEALRKLIEAGLKMEAAKAGHVPA